jgi:hypothetical protein
MPRSVFGTGIQIRLVYSDLSLGSVEDDLSRDIGKAIVIGAKICLPGTVITDSRFSSATDH